ncbi:MAG: hypothetical protein K2I44_07860 [Muribaculaceae bacterium]|nr:hypothetical protein [Muribaculaceae bacterium]
MESLQRVTSPGGHIVDHTSCASVGKSFFLTVFLIISCDCRHPREIILDIVAGFGRYVAFSAVISNHLIELGESSAVQK